MELQKCLVWGNYAESIKKIMKEIGVTAAELGRRTGLNEATIRRNLSEEHFNLNTFLLILFGLHLPYQISDSLLEMAPQKLMRGIKNHQWYKNALMYQYQWNISELQTYFAKHGVDPL